MVETGKLQNIKDKKIWKANKEKGQITFKWMIVHLTAKFAKQPWKSENSKMISPMNYKKIIINVKFHTHSNDLLEQSKMKTFTQQTPSKHF